MTEILEASKQALGLIIGLISLSAAIGGAFVSRYKIKILIEKNKEADNKAKEIENSIKDITNSFTEMKGKVKSLQKELDSKVSSHEFKLIDEKVMNATKTIDAVSQEFSKQKELFTEIRIEMGSMHTELKNINQLLSELKSCAIISPKNQDS